MSQHHPGVNFQVIMEAKDYENISQLSPAFLAYIGDAVYELYVRTRYLFPPRKVRDYHNQVVAQVRAETQAKALQRLTPYLTTVEQDIVRRGRNAASGCPRRLQPEIYQQATSLETLIGYLYLQDTHRLHELLETLIL
uniref:ribonuclease III domain-containing protein n=2 Tax=Cyanothece sp. BG0011 TaxID=2082950 RepID=UPI000D1F62DE